MLFHRVHMKNAGLFQYEVFEIQFVLRTLVFTKSSGSAHAYHLDAPWRNNTSLGLSQFQHCVPQGEGERPGCIKDENARAKNSSGKGTEECKS